VHSCVWDYTFVLNRDHVVQAQNDPLSDEALAFLRGRFATGPRTHGWPGHDQYRFVGADQWILIWADDGQADWWLAAEDADSLICLIDDVWDADRVGQSLWSHTSAGEAILRQVRVTRQRG
jgi:hypothetical protein